MKPNIIGGPIGSDTDLMLDVYMTRAQREAYERLRKDAERYRWVRSATTPGYLHFPNGEIPDGLALDALDAAIDAAMRE